MKAQLCQCTNCNQRFIDTNPNKQPLVEADHIQKELILTTDKETGDLIHACPNCLTDSYLIDN